MLETEHLAAGENSNLIDRQPQIAIFHQIARHLLALVYLIAELVLGELLPSLGSS